MTMFKMTIDTFERTRKTPWAVGTIKAKTNQFIDGILYYIELGTYGIRVTHYNSDWSQVTNFWTYGDYCMLFDVPFDRDSYTTE